MIGHIGVHRADDRHFIHVPGHVRKDITDFDAALTVGCEGVG